MVLLDENIPHDVRPCLAHHETFTVAYMGWGGLKNGQLLETAESAGFGVLITGDKTLEYQQNLGRRGIALVALSAVNWPLIEPNMAKVVEAVADAKPGTLTRVDYGSFTRRRAKKQEPGSG
jgi:hypothetical protein